MRTLRVHIDVPADELLRYYRGEARHLIATSDQGLRVALPVETLRRYVTGSGIRGWFRLTLGPNDKLVRLARD